MADVTPRVPPRVDPEDFVLRSGVRSGLKREFAFALKAQAEMLLTPMSRTRSGKISRPSVLSRGTAAKRPRKSESGDAAGCGGFGPSEGTHLPLRPEAASRRVVEFMGETAVTVISDDEQMPAGASDAASSAIPVNGESVAEDPVAVQDDSGPLRLTPQAVEVEASAMEETASPIQADERPLVESPAGTSNVSPPIQIEVTVMEETASPTQTKERPLVQTPDEMDNRVSQKVENAMPEKSPRRFTRSLLRSAVEANAAPEKPVKANTAPEKSVRRFTRSLLKAAVEEPQLPTVGKSADASSAAGGGSDASDSANGPDEELRITPKKKMELKMSKKISLTKIPSNIKDLLATGLLEGLTVKYVTRSYDKLQQGGLRGVIKDGGILCFCASCKGLKTVSAYHFEQHAGSTKKHPSDYIYLENGSTMRDVIRACTSAPLDMLESTIQKAISSVKAKSSTCGKCKEPSDKSHIGKLASVCESCLIAKLSPTSPKQSQEVTSSARPSKSVLAPKSSDSASKSISSQKKNSQGRMTKKDLRLHKLVFMDDILPDGTEVAYYARGQRLLKGYIKGGGIFCHCCDEVISPSQFEAHAGWASRRKPYLNIYTSNGVSLHELSVSLSKDKKFSVSENDDLCRICADGGDLLLCDLCPRAFHKECVGLTSIPKGDWYCPCCQSMHQKEKFVEHNENAIAAGRVEGVDPIEQIYKRCIRIVETQDTDIGGCVLCRCHDFSKGGFGPRTVLLCDQCEREFHVGCLKDHNMADLKELPEGMWFCSSDCSRIHAALQKLLTSGLEQLPNFQSDVIKRKHEQKGLSKDIDLDVRWRLLSGKAASPETRLFLSKAVSIFHESFNPVVDSATGEDLIPAMVYGRDLRDQEFGGMYCAVLTVNLSVVSAAILRVFGCEVAELPLVATSRESQGQGYFQSLFSCIERMLASLKVKHFVLPAAGEAVSIWIEKFGFSSISIDQLHEYTKGSRTMTFQGTSILHKLVPQSPTDNVLQKES